MRKITHFRLKEIENGCYLLRDIVWAEFWLERLSFVNELLKMLAFDSVLLLFEYLPALLKLIHDHSGC